MTNQDIIKKFKDEFLGNSLFAKNFYVLESRRIYLKNKYNESPRDYKRIMDKRYKNGCNYLELSDTFAEYDLNYNNDNTDDFKEYVLKYLNNLDDAGLIEFLKNLFNNYIKVINEPDKYVRTKQDQANLEADVGFINFNWASKEEMQALKDCADKIEEFSKNLKENGIDLELIPIKLNEENPIIKVLNGKDLHIKAKPKHGKTTNKTKTNTKTRNAKKNNNSKRKTKIDEKLANLELNDEDTKTSETVEELNLDEKIMNVINGYNERRESTKRRNIEDTSRSPEQKWDDAIQKLTMLTNRESGIYNEIQKLLAGDNTFELSIITPSQLKNVIENYNQLGDAKYELLVYEAKKFCIDKYKERKENGEYSDIPQSILNDIDAIVEVEKGRKFSAIKSSNSHTLINAINAINDRRDRE